MLISLYHTHTQTTTPEIIKIIWAISHPQLVGCIFDSFLKRAILGIYRKPNIDIIRPIWDQLTPSQSTATSTPPKCLQNIARSLRDMCMFRLIYDLVEMRKYYIIRSSTTMRLSGISLTFPLNSQLYIWIFILYIYRRAAVSSHCLVEVSRVLALWMARMDFMYIRHIRMSVRRFRKYDVGWQRAGSKSRLSRAVRPAMGYEALNRRIDRLRSLGALYGVSLRRRSPPRESPIPEFPWASLLLLSEDQSL